MKSKEENGFYLLFVSRGPFFTSILVVIFPIVLDLAKFNRNADGYVNLLGILVRPSSFVFIVNSFTSLIIMVLSPFYGAISDINNNRKKMIQYSSTLFIVTIAFTFLITLSERLWFVAAIIQVISLSIFELSNVLFNAYMPEIGENENDYSKLSSFSTFTENLSILLFLAVLPFVLKTNKMKNLISHTNFEYDSLADWNITSTSSGLLQCSKEIHFTTNESSCWKNGILESGINIYIKKDDTISIVQESDASQKTKGTYSFSTLLEAKSSEDGDQNADFLAKGQMHVTQYNKFDVKIGNTKVNDYKIKHNIQTFHQKHFYLDSDAKTIKFELFLSSNKDSILSVEKMETVMPVDNSQIYTLYFTGAFFGIISIAATFLFKDRPRNGTTNAEVVLKRGLTDIYTTLVHSYNQRIIFLYLIVNMFWNGGYVVWSLILIIYLEDKFIIGSYNLAILFTVMCFSVMIGALLNYSLRNKISPWTLATVFYGIWGLIPFTVLTKRLDFPNYAYFIFVFIIGISLGVISSIRYVIFSTLIPPSQEGKYMGIFYLTCKFMDFFGNIFILILMKIANLETITCLSCVFFLVSFVLMIITTSCYDVKNYQTKPDLVDRSADVSITVQDMNKSDDA